MSHFSLQDASGKAGQAQYPRSSSQPENKGDTAFDAVVIELKDAAMK